MILFAILLLWLPWSACLAAFIPMGAPGRTSLVAGYGMLTGLLMIPVIMRALSYLGLGLSFGSIALTALLVPATLVYIANKRKPGHQVTKAVNDAANFGFTLANLLIAVIIILIVIRTGSLILEVFSRPLFPWDATAHWATKAKVWFEYRDILPFVDRGLWLESDSSFTFTDRHPGYPKTIPLLQTWMCLALGRWNESVMNIPWLMCYFAIGLIFYGQLRFSRSDRLTALAMTYMLLSMPLLNTHTALAGYADLFMAASFGAAVMAFYHWSTSREPWQGLLAATFAIACLLIKNEGLFWLMSLLPGLAFCLFSYRRATTIIAVGMITAVGLLFVFPSAQSIAGHTVLRLKLGFYPEGIGHMLTTLFFWDNWHLLPHLFLALLPLCFFYSSLARHRLAPVTAVIATSLGLFIFLYLFTKESFGVVNQTSINRLALHLVPAIAFVTGIAWIILQQQFIARPGQSEDAK